MENEKKEGSTETRTRILGFRVPGANHYTIEPAREELAQFTVLE